MVTGILGSMVLHSSESTPQQSHQQHPLRALHLDAAMGPRSSILEKAAGYGPHTHFLPAAAALGIPVETLFLVGA